METTLLHLEEGSKGTLQLMHNETEIARITYSKLDPQNIIVDHTSVAPTFKGQGIGKKIIEELVFWARNNKIKVLPLCSFAKTTLEKHEEWSDILK